MARRISNGIIHEGHTIMDLFKKFRAASGQVVPGRYHGVSEATRSGMSSRVAAEYRAAGGRGRGSENQRS